MLSVSVTVLNRRTASYTPLCTTTLPGLTFSHLLQRPFPQQGPYLIEINGQKGLENGKPSFVYPLTARDFAHPDRLNIVSSLPASVVLILFL